MSEHHDLDEVRAEVKRLRADLADERYIASTLRHQRDKMEAERDQALAERDECEAMLTRLARYDDGTGYRSCVECYSWEPFDGVVTHDDDCELGALLRRRREERDE
jgi:hypothetical protein